MLEKIMNLQILLYAMAVLGVLGAVGMFVTNLTYRRTLKKTDKKTNLKEKWLTLWQTRDRLLRRMNRFVWYPALLSTAILAAALYLVTSLDLDGLPFTYVYVGTAVPLALLLFRQALDFSYQETLITDSLADYIAQMRTWVEEVPAEKKADPVLQEEVVEHIVDSIRQTAASGSHFSKMLTPEEESIMREVIREFMN